MARLLDTIRMDKSRVEFAASFEEAAAQDRAYWHAATPAQRFEALELMRQMVYDYDPATARSPRVLEIARVPWSCVLPSAVSSSSASVDAAHHCVVTPLSSSN